MTEYNDDASVFKFRLPSQWQPQGHKEDRTLNSCKSRSTYNIALTAKLIYKAEQLVRAGLMRQGGCLGRHSGFWGMEKKYNEDVRCIRTRYAVGK